MESDEDIYEDADSSPVDPIPKLPETEEDNPPLSSDQDDPIPRSLTIEDLAPPTSNTLATNYADLVTVSENLESESKTATDQSHADSIPSSVVLDQSHEDDRPTSVVSDQSEPKVNANLDSLETGDVVIDQSPDENPADTADQLELVSEDNTELKNSEEMDKPKPSAMCQYRWTNIVNTTSSDIGFYPSYAPNDPILLSWDEKTAAYFSSDVRITCGDYHGSMVVDGKIYPVEEFSVRTYTFEVDLFMKDDVIEDEVTTSQSQQQEAKFEQQKTAVPVDTYKDLGSSGASGKDSLSQSHESKVTSKVEDLVRHQMTDSDGFRNGLDPNFQEPAMSSSLKSDVDMPVSSMKRDSPVGDDDAGKFLETSTGKILSDSAAILEKYRSSPERRTPMEGIERSSSRASDNVAAGMDVIDDVVSGSPARPLSRGSAASATSAGLEVGEGHRGSRPPSIGAGSAHESVQGGVRQSPSQDAIYGRPQSKASDRFSPSSSLRHDDASKASGSTRNTPINDPLVGGARAPGSPAHSSHSLSRATPPKDVTSPVLGSNHSSTRATPQREMPVDNIYGSKERITEYGDTGRSNSLPASRPPSHPASRHGSQYSSRAQSLASMTSEQELAQYLDESRTSSIDKLMPPPGVSPHPDESLMDPPIMRGLDRPTSVPNWSTQQQMSPDKRSVTPDNRIRVLPSSTDFTSFRNAQMADKLEDTRGRASSASISAAASRSSSRTITPVVAENGTRESNSDRIQDLEASVGNLRKLLSSREAEVHTLTAQMGDLKDINRSLKDELDHRGRRHTPVASVLDSLEFKQLQSEKEILASEVVSLRDEVQRLTNGHRGQASGSGRSSASSAISDYSPNNPSVLQRKIVDLEAHIRDLHEVTESTNTSLARTEEKLKLLQEENKQLKSRALSVNDLQTDGDQHMLRVELRTLREDIRSLKERNYHLTEENMRLQEGQRLGSKEIAGGGPRLSSSLKSDDGIIRQSTNYTTSSSYRRDFAPATHVNSTAPPSSSSSSVAPKRIHHEDLAPKDLRQSALNRSYDYDQRMQDTSSRLLHQRNTLESTRLRHQHQSKESQTRSKTEESLRNGVLYSDRSRPDGEVSEKLYADKYTKSPSTYEKRPYDDHTRDRESTSYLDKHSSYAFLKSRESTDLRSRERYDLGEREDKYRYQSEVGRDRDKRVTSPGRHHSSAAISSKDNKYISGNLDFQRYQSSAVIDDPGDDSDTATDILLAQDSTSRGPIHQRKTSIGSDGSPSSLSDVDDPSDSALRRRSKSVDTNRGQDSTRSRQLSTLQRSGSATRPLSSIENMNVRSSAGHRSVLPAPLVTQHNKGEILASKNTASLLNSSLTHGLRPFAPRSPADIRPEDVVKFSRLGGKLTQGVVKYVGHLPGRSEAYLGVELDKDDGKHDGTFEGIRYFKCKPSKGVFVAFNKVVMAWAP